VTQPGPDIISRPNVIISTLMETYHILLIEDDPEIGQSLVDDFKHHGFEMFVHCGRPVD
jgi:hypothetical protein